MRKRTGRLLSLLIIGALAMNGCGAANTPANTDAQTQDTQTGSDAQANSSQEDGNAQSDAAANTNSDAAQSDTAAGTGSADSQADAASGTSNASDNSESEIPRARGTSSGTAAGIGNAAQEADGETHNFVGIITDATQYSVSAQSALGNTFSLTIPESGVQGNLRYLTIGQIATITYTGSLDENHATLVGLSDSSLLTGIYVEEYAFAIKIINAVKTMNVDALASLTNFPVFVDKGNGSKGPVNDAETFKKIDSDVLFTEALVERMGNYNLFDLEYTDAGFVMGDGGPNITFDVDDDGILGIIGINCTATPSK